MKARMAIAAAITVLMISSPGLAADGDMTVDGNLGVGTDAPRAEHHVIDTNNDSWLMKWTRGVNTWGFASGGDGTGLFSENTGAMTWWATSSGNIGLGTYTPTDLLHVEHGYIKTRVFPADDITQGLTGYSLESRETGGGTHKWRLYTAPVGGGWGVPGNSLTIYEYGTGVEAARMVFQGNTGNVGIGVDNPTTKLHVDGIITGTRKDFDIPDPRYNDNTKRLIHSTLEGPEVGVYYRGEVKLEKGGATVTLPPYFEALTRKEDRTVLLTAKFENNSDLLCNIAASEVKDGQFTIMAYGVSDPAQCNHKAYWEVKAVRSDTAKLKVEDTREKTKDEINAKDHGTKLKEKEKEDSEIIKQLHKKVVMSN